MKTISMTVEFDVDIRGEVTEKKFLKLMRDGTKLKNPIYTDISVDGVPNKMLKQIAQKELERELIIEG